MVAATLAAAPAGAHKTSLAAGEVTLVGAEATVRLIVSQHDLAVALAIPTDLVTPVPQEAFDRSVDALRAYLDGRISIWADVGDCVADPSVGASKQGDEVVLLRQYLCPGGASTLGVAYLMFFDIDPAHRALFTLRPGVTPQEVVFDRTLTRIEISGVAETIEGGIERFFRIFALGVEHILAGIDHLLFLLCLLIGTARLKQLLIIITAFTLAHSLTLALAWFGWVALPARLVETAIALTIAFVAAEILLGVGAERRWIEAGLFGLIHGLGFYGVLSDLGLDRGSAVMTLLAFNLGVEAGQLLAVAVAVLPLFWWRRQSWHAPTARMTAAALLGVALYWAAERALFA